MRYLSAFNGKTLHDGSGRRALTKLPINLSAEVEKVQMANGVWFDPNYGTGSVAAPQPFEAQFLMKFSTKAAAEAEEAALKGLIGDNGTATASLNSGATAQTCNATCKAVTITHKRSDFAFTAVLYFEPFTDWS